MDDRSPKVWARVPSDVRDEAQALADQHYGGNLSLLVRNAVTRFMALLRTMPTELPPGESEERPAA